MAKTKQEIHSLVHRMELSYPIEIDHPENGFNGYLLRTKVNPQEDCTQSMILYEPTLEGYRFIGIPLPEYLDDRIAIRKAWWILTTKGHYAAINCDMSPDVDPDQFERDFPTDPLDIKALADILIGNCAMHFPSYNPFALVLHKNQLVERDGNVIGERPIHMHILLKAFKRRTSNELDWFR